MLRNKKTAERFPMVAQLLSKGVELYEPKGPVIWLTKIHLQKIEKRLQLFEDLKSKIKSIIEIENL